MLSLKLQWLSLLLIPLAMSTALLCSALRTASPSIARAALCRSSGVQSSPPSIARTALCKRSSLHTCLQAVSVPAARTASYADVRRAVASDFEQIADLRAAVEPVMAAGGAGFLGAKASKIDPEVASRKQLAAKVGELISGESIALIALQQATIVGTVDCTITEARGQTPRHLHLKNMLVLPANRSVLYISQCLSV
jgi:hypothetical protein